MQDLVQRNFGASPVAPINMFLVHIFVAKEMVVIIEEDHQANIMIKENFQTMKEEADLLVMMVIKIEEEDHQVMEEIEDPQGDTEMIETDLQVEKEIMIQREGCQMTGIGEMNHQLIEMLLRNVMMVKEEVHMMIEDTQMRIKAEMNTHDTQW